jgi:hypothetical protein
MSIPELIDKILLITSADNTAAIIREVLESDLQKLYNEAYVAGQMSVLEKETIDEGEVIIKAIRSEE